MAGGIALHLGVTVCLDLAVSTVLWNAIQSVWKTATSVSQGSVCVKMDALVRRAKMSHVMLLVLMMVSASTDHVCVNHHFQESDAKSTIAKTRAQARESVWMGDACAVSASKAMRASDGRALRGATHLYMVFVTLVQVNALVETDIMGEIAQIGSVMTHVHIMAYASTVRVSVTMDGQETSAKHNTHITTNEKILIFRLLIACVRQIMIACGVLAAAVVVLQVRASASLGSEARNANKRHAKRPKRRDLARHARVEAFAQGEWPKN